MADLLVAGIVRYPEDLLPVVTDQESLLVNGGELYLTPAYWQPEWARHCQLRDRAGRATPQRPGRSPSTRADLRRLYGGEALAEGADASSGDRAITTAGTRRAIGLESAALAAFAVLTALAGLLLVGQTIGRQVVLEAAEHRSCRRLA